ncbi:MAG: two-component sensor histidine kinase, partial [Muribaculaceae bacterium]
MKKYTIWILTTLMAFTLASLLFIEIFYMKSIVAVRHEQFSQGVRQSLISVVVRLEQDETRYYLEDELNKVESQSIYAQHLGSTLPRQEGIKYSFTTASGLEADLTIKGDANEITKLQSGASAAGNSMLNARELYRGHFLYQKSMLDEVILNIISTASNRPIVERADSATVRKYLRQELDTLGLTMPFEFAVVNRAGIIQYRSPGYDPASASDENTFTQTLFPRDPSSSHNFLKVYFPTKKDYIFKSISFLVPAFALSLIVLIVFVYTIIMAFRQKKLSEMKNDFINNMTHEFKTPISSI